MTFRALLQTCSLGLGWEGDSPEVLHLFTFNKFNPISEESLNCAHLRDNASRSLSTATIVYDDSGTDRQFTTQLNGCPMLVQIGGTSRHGEGALLAIFPGQTNRSFERDSPAPPFEDRSAIRRCGRGCG